MEKGKIYLGKWHFKLGIIPIYWKTRGYLIHFGIFKIIGRPFEGEIIQPKHYKGFWLRKEFDWRGFEINL